MPKSWHGKRIARVGFSATEEAALKQRARVLTPEEQQFYAGFTNGGVLRRTGGSTPDGIHDLLARLEKFEVFMERAPGTVEAEELWQATRNLVYLLRKSLSAEP